MLNLRKKLLVSIFTLMLALVAVSTTTYAWFTLGNSAEVSGMDMTVHGTDGLTVRVVRINDVTFNSTDAYNYDEWKISHNLAEYFAANQYVFIPVTMVGNQATGTLNEISCAFDGTGNTIQTYNNVAVASHKYIEIVFEFRSESPVHVLLEDSQASTKSGSHSFTTPIDVVDVNGVLDDVAAGESVENARLANALRLAISSTGEDFEVINPAEYDASSTQYGQWGTVLKEGSPVKTAATAYFEELTGYTLTVPGEYSYKTDTKVLDFTEFEKHDDPASTEDVVYYTGQVTIKLWLEGWDADCFNAITWDSASFSVKFKGESAA